MTRRRAHHGDTQDLPPLSLLSLRPALPPQFATREFRQVTAGTAVCACGQPVSGATICGLCLGQFRDALRAITGPCGETKHGLGTDLDLALSRQGSHGGSTARRGGASVLPFDQRASAAAVELRGVLARTVSLLVAGRAAPPYDIAAMAGWLHDHLARFRQHDRASEMATMILDAVDRARRAVDLPPERVYAGPCDCGHGELMTKPGRALVTCPACGATYGIAERQQWLRSQLEDMLGSITWCLSIARSTGRPVSEHTARSWIRRHKLQPAHYQPSRKPDGKPEPLYRLGEILRLAGENPSRPRMDHDEQAPAGGANAPGTRPI